MNNLRDHYFGVLLYIKKSVNSLTFILDIKKTD